MFVFAFARLLWTNLKTHRLSWILSTIAQNRLSSCLSPIQHWSGYKAHPSTVLKVQENPVHLGLRSHFILQGGLGSHFTLQTDLSSRFKTAYEKYSNWQVASQWGDTWPRNINKIPENTVAQVKCPLNTVHIFTCNVCVWVFKNGVYGNNWWCSHLKARLHQASASTLRKLHDDTPEWGCNPFSSVSIDFNENRIASVIAEWSQRWRCWRLV